MVQEGKAKDAEKRPKTSNTKDYQMLASKKPTGRRPGFNGETPCKTVEDGRSLVTEKVLG